MGRLVKFAWLGLCLFFFGACESADTARPKATSCESDLDCAEGRHCDPRVGCVACLFDTHCGDGQRCQDGSCASRVTCSTNADCKSGQAPVCDPVAKECFRCISDKDCGSEERCRKNSCEPVQNCENSLDCASGTVCDRERKHCVECLAEADCGASETCVESKCVPRCASDKDCAANGLLCDPDRGHCTECVSHEDCPSVYHCSAGRCTRDVCAQGASECMDGEQALRFCAPDGDKWLSLYCLNGQSCHVNAGRGMCSGWVCIPGEKTCSADGRIVESCSADGLSKTVAEQCGAQQVCSGAKCLDIVCEPGTKLCKGGNVHECAADGLSTSTVLDCLPGSYCDAQSFDCKPQICSPSALACDGNSYGKCNAQGSGLENATPCTSKEICKQGACHELVCASGETRCDEQGRVRQCSADGTLLSVMRSCGKGERCYQNGNQASCISNQCVAGEAMCDGDVATKCKADGSGAEALGTDCKKLGKACFAGECKASACTAGTLLCSNNDVYLCADNGTRLALFQDCSDAQYCSTDAPGCKAQVCAPNQKTCVANKIATCRNDGSGFASEIACKANETCEAGECKPSSCKKNEYFCKDGNVHVCNQFGTGSSVASTCSSFQFCAMQGSHAVCINDVCSEGRPTCNGNIATTCKPDGSGYELPGTDCKDKNCSDGLCLDRVCVPDTYSCNGQVSRHCNARGSAYDVTETCRSDQYCSALTGKCALKICAPLAKVCTSQTLATCKSDGSGAEASGTLCKAPSGVCTLSGCAAAASERVANSPRPISGETTRFAGNLFYITNTRKLTTIDGEFEPAWNSTQNKLRFLVFEASSPSGPFLLKADTVVTTERDSELKSSGPINVTLSANNYYLIGYYGSGTFYESTVSAPVYLSFGRTLGGLLQSSVPLTSISAPQSTRLYPMVLRTELP